MLKLLYDIKRFCMSMLIDYFFGNLYDNKGFNCHIDVSQLAEWYITQSYLFQTMKLPKKTKQN